MILLIRYQIWRAMPKVKRLSCSNFKTGRNVGTLSGLLDAGGSNIEGPYRMSLNLHNNLILTMFPWKVWRQIL